MTKAKQHSKERIQAAVALITNLTPLEIKRQSNQRKRQMEVAYSTMVLHATKLDLQIPTLSRYYHAEQYFENARYIAAQLEEKKSDA